MKLKHILAFALLAGTAACSQDQPVSVNQNEPIGAAKLSTIKGISTKTHFTATLQTMEGVAVTEASQIKPKTSYKLVVKGNAPVQYQLKIADGFKIISTAANNDQASLRKIGANGETVFVISTDGEAKTSLYASIVPLHLRESQLFREEAKGFLFPASKE